MVSVEKDITETWDPGEGNVESSCQLFAFAAVDDDCRVDVEPAIVVELDNGECDDKQSGEKGDCEYYRLLSTASDIRSFTLTEGARACFNFYFVECACKAIKALEGPKEAGSH